MLSEEKMQAMLHAVNQKMHSAGLYFKYDSIDPGHGYISYPSSKVHSRSLIILASFDFCYYHQLEFVFRDVVWHDIPEEAYWPDHWNKPQLILLGEAEKKAKGLGHLEGFLFAFNIGSFSEEQYCILAKRLFINQGTVFYYDREKQAPLAPGERVVWWITPSKPASNSPSPTDSEQDS